MLTGRRKPSNAAIRRIEKAANLPRVPVVVPDSNTSSGNKAERSSPVAESEQMDERIKRMIELAYT